MDRLGVRSDPTNGTLMTGSDFDGVRCDVCHRMWDPFSGGSFFGADDRPSSSDHGENASGQYFVSANAQKRAGFADADEPDHLLSAQPLHQHRLAKVVDPVCLKHALGVVQPDRADFAANAPLPAPHHRKAEYPAIKVAAAAPKSSSFSFLLRDDMFLKCSCRSMELRQSLRGFARRRK